MSTALATGGFLAPLLGSGAGSGASGQRIFFVLYDTDGVLAPAIDLSASGETQISLNGASFANRAGSAPTHVSDGLYYYELDESEQVAPKVLLKIEKTGYRTVHQQEDVGTTIDEAITSIGNTIAVARDNINANIAVLSDDVLTAIDAVPTVAEIDAQLSATHGSDSWEGATVAAIDAQLSSAHGAGSWEGTTAVDIAEAVLDQVVEGSHTLGDLVRGIVAMLAGKSSGYNTGTIVVKSLDGTKTRFTITTDTTGRLTSTAGDLT